MQEISNLFWKILCEYIPNKDHNIAAHHLINELIDAGIDEEDLWALTKGSVLLKNVVSEYLDDAYDYDIDDED